MMTVGSEKFVLGQDHASVSGHDRRETNFADAPCWALLQLIILTNWWSLIHWPLEMFGTA